MFLLFENVANNNNNNQKYSVHTESEENDYLMVATSPSLHRLYAPEVFRFRFLLHKQRGNRDVF